ncbi:hypothetical protein ABH920_004530 [Catenulispora sp. EB89]
MERRWLRWRLAGTPMRQLGLAAGTGTTGHRLALAAGGENGTATHRCVLEVGGSEGTTMLVAGGWWLAVSASACWWPAAAMGTTMHRLALAAGTTGHRLELAAGGGRQLGLAASTGTAMHRLALAAGTTGRRLELAAGGGRQRVLVAGGENGTARHRRALVVGAATMLRCGVFRRLVAGVGGAAIGPVWPGCRRRRAHIGSDHQVFSGIVGGSCPTSPSSASRSKSAWPTCRAYSSCRSAAIRRRFGRAPSSPVVNSAS